MIGLEWQTFSDFIHVVSAGRSQGESDKSPYQASERQSKYSNGGQGVDWLHKKKQRVKETAKTESQWREKCSSFQIFTGTAYFVQTQITQIKLWPQSQVDLLLTA